MVIAWRKCYLEKKAKGADDGRRVVPAAAVHAFMAGGSSSTTVVDEEREDEDRIHFKVVGAGGRGRKRKSGCNTVAAGSSGTTVTGTVDISSSKHRTLMLVVLFNADRGQKWSIFSRHI